jgi:hypothetical protein
VRSLDPQEVVFRKPFSFPTKKSVYDVRNIEEMLLFLSMEY